MDIFAERVKVTLGNDLVADTTAETKSAVADASGFDETTYIVKFGDVDAAAIITLTPKENTASSTTSPTPTAVTLDTISSSAGVITSGAVVLTELSANLDDKIVIITVKHSAHSKRYQFLSITATVESYELDCVLILQGLPKSLPVTQSSDVVATAQAAS